MWRDSTIASSAAGGVLSARSRAGVAGGMGDAGEPSATVSEGSARRISEADIDAKDASLRLTGHRPLGRGVLRQAVTTGGHFKKISQSQSTCVDTGQKPYIWDIAKNEQNCNGVYLY